MKRLFLEDLRDMDLRELKDHIAGNYAGEEGAGYMYGDSSEPQVNRIFYCDIRNPRNCMKLAAGIVRAMVLRDSGTYMKHH